MTPEKPELEFFTTIEANLLPGIIYGETPVGMRMVVPITGGKFTGPEFSGEILQTGSDWNHYRPKDHGLHIWARYDLRTSDGVLISVINEGVGHVSPDVPMKVVAAEPIGDGVWNVRTWPRFEAPIDSRYGWLNRTAFVAVIPYPEKPGVATIHVFRVK